MSAELLVRLFCILVMALAFAWGVLTMHDEELGRGDRERYGAAAANWLLPFYVLLLTALTWIVEGRQSAAEAFLTLTFGTFLHISLYYAILLPLLPKLRSRISARACALLWMTPNYLYLFFRTELMPAPKWVIRPPMKLVWVLFWIWLGGACAVLVWKIVSHLFFRRRILREAREACAPAIRSVWESEWEKAGVKLKKLRVKLLISPAVSTPLSVGLFRSSTRVVLPDRPYGAEELTLILRHEILHICRGDAWAKFFLTFCTAMCWFNPLMWLAMKRCAEDLELSCDEAVLIGAGEETRRRYAALILSTAGDERGFTTCLSASAEALRYRLKNVVQPRKLRSGALTVALLFSVLAVSFGHVALAYDSASGAELIFGSHSCEEVTLESADLDSYDILHYGNYALQLQDDPDYIPFHGPEECRDEQALFDYFASLTLDTVTGGDPSLGRTREDYYYYDTPEGYTVLRLTDRSLRVARLYDGGSTETYYLPDGADWDYIESLFTVYPAVRATLGREGDLYPKTGSFTLEGVWDVTDGQRTLIAGVEKLPEQSYAGTFGQSLYETASLEFSIPTVGPVEFITENWDRTSSESRIVQPGETFPLAGYSAHYTVRASFPFYDGKTIEATFVYDNALLADTDAGSEP